MTTLKGLSLMIGTGFSLGQGSGCSGNEDQVTSLLSLGVSEYVYDTGAADQEVGDSDSDS